MAGSDGRPLLLEAPPAPPAARHAAQNEAQPSYPPPYTTTASACVDSPHGCKQAATQATHPKSSCQQPHDTLPLQTQPQLPLQVPQRRSLTLSMRGPPVLGGAQVEGLQQVHRLFKGVRRQQQRRGRDGGGRGLALRQQEQPQEGCCEALVFWRMLHVCTMSMRLGAGM
jgi:hypothetical protein